MTQTAKLNYNKKQFKNDAEYKKFLDDKMKILNEKIMENIDVFKRLADR
jgi:hypothetical protein